MDEATVERLKRGIVGSPFGKLVGLVTDRVEPGEVWVRLPYRTDVTTVGDLVHGGAIASLLDAAATAAAWSEADPGTTRGTTIGFSISFLAASRSTDLVAKARVVRRGRSVVFIDVAVEAEDGARTAQGFVTYKLG